MSSAASQDNDVDRLLTGKHEMRLEDLTISRLGLIRNKERCQDSDRGQCSLTRRARVPVAGVCTGPGPCFQ